MNNINKGEKAVLNGVRKGEKILEKGIKESADFANNMVNDIKNSNLVNKVESAIDKTTEKLNDIIN